VRLLLPLTLLAALLIPAGVAYRLMIDVKPRRRAAFRPDTAELGTLQADLMRHVQVLGGAIGERNLDRPASLRAAADYIAGIGTAAGFRVTEERFQADGRPCANLVMEEPGSDPTDGIVVVGAHYDSALGSPGANDNGTGIALLLEMARALKGAGLGRTVRYVAFANEERPHFGTSGMGSWVHAGGARRRGERIHGMLSLETVGYYVDAPRSQRYPAPLSLLYPSTGNFLAVVGNLQSRRLVVDFLRHLTEASDFPVEGVAALESISGIGWSDHWAFWREGYPALMLTDTAPFRYPEYHGPGDRPDRVTAPAFARAAHAIIQAVRGLAASSTAAGRQPHPARRSVL